ncbi:MAG: hypothetical protein O2960_23110, partial [Verrucomicrobia bacterium]|nr:hypothetical protein [Verrucomicrobiota bacterium]
AGCWRMAGGVEGDRGLFVFVEGVDDTEVTDTDARPRFERIRLLNLRRRAHRPTRSHRAGPSPNGVAPLHDKT